jgi:hypothetical protein
MILLDPLKRLLDHLSAALDPQRRAAIDRRYRRTLDYEPVDRPPFIVSAPLPDDCPFRLFPHSQAFVDPQKMLFNELVHAFDTSIALCDRYADDLPLTIRANFGTVLIASMFAAPVEQVGDNPPWVRHDAGRTPPLAQISCTDPEDASRGWIPRVVETLECYCDVLEGWPDVKRQLRIVLPDLQGPFDNLELICGSDLFLQLVTEAEAVDRALAVLARAQVHVARYLSRWITDGPTGYCHQHAVGLKGNLLLRNDSCIMVSADMYRRQIAPHDEHVLREMGGGGVHCCGDFGHLVDAFLDLPSIQALDFGQSEMNDADAIYRRAAEKKIALIRVAVSADELVSGSAANRFPTGVVFICRDGYLATLPSRED